MDPKETAKPEDVGRQLGSPYGPHPHGTDEAAGGADSSPYETVPSGEKRAKADEVRRQNRDDGDQLNPTE
jgi:hypothetical protein